MHEEGQLSKVNAILWTLVGVMLVVVLAAAVSRAEINSNESYVIQPRSPHPACTSCIYGK